MNSIANMMAKLALDNMLRVSVSAARLYLHKAVVDIIRAYKGATGSAAYSAFPPAPGQGGAQPQAPYLPDDLSQLPLFALALQKGMLFRGGADVKSDERSALVYRTLTMPVASSKYFIQPLLLPLHRLEPEDGRALVLSEGQEPPAPAPGKLSHTWW